MHDNENLELNDKSWIDLAFESVVLDGTLFMFPKLFEEIVDIAEDNLGVLDAAQRRELRQAVLHVLSRRQDVHRLPHSVFARDMGQVNTRGGWQYSPFIQAAIARLHVECDGDEGRIDVDKVVDETMRCEPLRGRTAELLEGHRTMLENYKPRLVIRMMPAVYKSESISERVLGSGESEELLEYARRRSKRLQLRVFLQLQPHSGIYVEPDGSWTKSDQPPGRRWGDALFGSGGKLATFRTDDINFQMLVGFLPKRDHTMN